MPRQNLYKILNVPQGAPAEGIKKAIIRELRLWTNRTNAPQIERRQEAERMVKLLGDAEAILLDPLKRAAYDRQLATAPRDERDVDESDLRGKADLIREARQLLTEGNIADALFVARKATERDGANPDAWAVLAQAQFRWGDTEDAIYEYKRAIKLRPNDASLYFDLGQVYESAERMGDALQQYQRSAQIEPKTPMFRAAVGALHLKTEQYDDAIKTLEQCVADEPENSTFQWFLAIAYAHSALETWTVVPEGGPVPAGCYATEKEQVRDAQRRVARALQMKFDDSELAAHIAKQRAEIDRMMQRRFFGSIAGPIVGGVIYSAFFGLGILLVIAYFFAARPPQFAINRERLKGVLTSGEETMALASGEEGIGGKLAGWVIGNVINGLFLPLMVPWNLIKNYTGRNAL